MAMKSYDFNEKAEEFNAKLGKSVPVTITPRYKEAKAKAIEMLESDINVRIADALILEGAISAAVTSTSGASLDEVIEAAEEAKTASKLS